MMYEIFPTPKKTVYSDEKCIIGKLGKTLCYIVCEDLKKQQEYAKVLAQNISEKIADYPEIISTGKKKHNNMIPICLLFDVDCKKEEGYILTITPTEILISASGNSGILYGINSLIQIMELKNQCLSLPCLKIEDWPDMKVRGLYIENRWGADRMKFEDWKKLIDNMAALKLNILGIGIYGCWGVQYENKVTEVWYLPLDNEPELKTPKRDCYFSVKSNQWINREYLPEMFTKDFFGDLIAYGKSKNITVHPEFNSLGHNTLIPGVYPEISAKDEKGLPTQKGFCTTNPLTYKKLFSIYESIIDKYLLPNDIHWIHIGMDEVDLSVPWCQCENCCKHSHEELFLNYIINLLKFFKDKGIDSVSIWFCEFLKYGGLKKEFIDRLKKEKLEKVLVINWYCYEKQVYHTLYPELGMRNMVNPMIGYYHWMLMDTFHPTNIFNVMRLAHKDHAEGVEGYCVYDDSYERNLHALSEFSWNKPETDGLDAFKEKYVKFYFKEEHQKAAQAFAYLDELCDREYGSWLGMPEFTLKFCYYTYSSRGWDRNFPGEVFLQVYKDEQKYRKLLKDAYNKASSAYDLFCEISSNINIDRNRINYYMVETLRYKVLLNEYQQLMDLDKLYNKQSFANVDDLLDSILEMKKILQELINNRKKMMLFLEETKSEYSVFMELKNETIHLQVLEDLFLYLTIKEEQYINESVKSFPPHIQPYLENKEGKICGKLFDLRDLKNIQNFEVNKLLR